MKIYFGIVIAVLVIESATGVLPPSIPVCKRNTPNMSECIVKAINSLAPRLKLGDLGGGFYVPPLEPFVIKELHFGEENGLKVYLKDINIKGTSNLQIEKLRVNVNDVKFDVLVGLPNLDIQAKYKMALNFLGAPVKSDGDYFTHFTNAKLKLSMSGHRYVKNGLEYIKFDPFVIKFNRGQVSNLKITNLFGGNKVLGEIVHAILLNNPDFVFKNIYPQLEATLSRTFTTIANKIVENASFDELFPL